jgi:uroporphyrin-III C-methyltransferase
MTGKVFLVGAGPGDPELLTLKAARVLQAADAVLHDDLVSSEILRLIPRHAQLHNVGKRCGDTLITQDEIDFLMVSLASAGLQVVRLKGGDPFVFGRITEEITALRSAHIDFEMVPGITSAMGAAAAAQVPLTDRRLSHGLIFLAAHHLPGPDPTNWDAVVAMKSTIVIYMPGHDYGRIASRLRSSGLPPQTPCAVISRASTPEEDVYLTDLDNLSNAPHLRAPTLLIVGDVLQFAKQSTWVVNPASWPSATSITAGAGAETNLTDTLSLERNAR